jgi:hypothetical protein
MSMPVAVFLGAGASKPFGYPLTRELLPEILRKLETEELFGILGDDAKEICKNFKADLEKILPGRNDIDPHSLPLITDIISLVDYTLSQGRALWPRQAPDELLDMRELLELALLEVLLEPAGGREPAALAMMERLSDWLLAQRERGVTLISTNYDVAAETCLYQKLWQSNQGIDTIDFGVSWLDPDAEELCEHQRPNAARLKILKLHGSLNWLRCACCENIYINRFFQIAKRAYQKEVTPYNTCHCGHAKLRMHIVAPSLFREIRDPNLLQIWKAALLALSQAAEWLIIGYSLPPEDIAIRSLFTRAYHMRCAIAHTPPLIRVVQHGSEAEARYRSFFPDCHYAVGGLESLVPTLE